MREALELKIRSRAFSDLPGRYHPGGAQVLAQLGMTDARDAWRWLWDSPYVEPLARERWDELSPDLLPRTLRSFLVRAPDEMGFVGRLPALTARTPSDLDGPDGTTLHFLRERVNTADMTGTYTINWCTCLATRDPGRPVAVSGGYVIRQPRRGSSDAEFFERCDAESQELASMADALINRHGPVHQLFDEGPLLYLEQWEVAAGERGRGLGAAVLERHLGRLWSEFRGLSTVVLQHTPAGFPEPFDMNAPDEICDEYARGVAGLMSYWDRRRPYRVLGTHARSIAFDVPRQPDHEEQLRMLARHLQQD